ncbi:hypothetical protein [Priestia endophytica]|uniref:hypothetical protein n=1 Tax=Priestia endophytica TaxID=135735 RepID=UPI00124E17E2|nr:hypothetical protein [Priestia endophytica]KAB2495192.1 hypothetical protein F8155_04105 [Priestia endophytica]
MKLYYTNEYIGEITNIEGEGFWMTGRLHPTENIVKFTDLFVALTDEDNEFHPEQYEEAWLDDTNWFVVDANGNERGIDLPAVYHLKDVWWKWR